MSERDAAVQEGTHSIGEALRGSEGDLRANLQERGVNERVITVILDRHADFRSKAETLITYFGSLETLLQRLEFEKKIEELTETCLECDLIQQDVHDGRPGNIFTTSERVEMRVPFPTYETFLSDILHHPENHDAENPFSAQLLAALYLLGADPTQKTGFEPTPFVEFTGANFRTFLSALHRKTTELHAQNKLHPLGDPDAGQNALFSKGVSLQDPYCWGEWISPSTHLLWTPDGPRSQEDIVNRNPLRANRIVITDGSQTIPYKLQEHEKPDKTGVYEDKKIDTSLTRYRCVGGASVNDTEALLKDDPAHALEQCESLFVSVPLATVLMHRTGGGVLADYNSNNDCARRDGGSRTSSGFVGVFCWFRGGGRFRVGGGGPGYAGPAGAVPSVVRVS